MTQTFTPFLFGAALALVCGASLAHDSWLAADERQVKAGSELGIGMTSGEHFPVEGSSIAPDRVDKAACLQGQTSVPLATGKRYGKFLRLSARPASDGAITCWVQLKPLNFDLDAVKVDEYMAEIDPPAAVLAAWNAAPAPKRWNETYTKNAKVLIPGAGATSASATAPVGLKLELMVPGDLVRGLLKGKLPVNLLRDGKPVAGVSVALTSERGGTPVRQRTDAQGTVEFAVPAAGRWMLSVTDLRPLDASAGRWESQFSTLVFDVPAAGK